MGGIETHEGPAAYKDAIDFLKVQPSAPALKWSSAMQKAAKDHIDDIGSKGQTSSLGSGKIFFLQPPKFCFQMDHFLPIDLRDIVILMNHGQKICAFNA